MIKNLEFPINIFKLLEHQSFRDRIMMFIGKRDINSLNMFLQGAFFIINTRNLEEKKEVEEFHEFHGWVSDYYKLEPSARGWCDIILQEMNGDKEKSLVEFFRLYDLFKKNIETQKT